MIRLTKEEIVKACHGLYRADCGDRYDLAIAQKLMDALELKNSIHDLLEETKAKMDKWTPQDSTPQFSIPVLDSIYEQEIHKISTLQFNSKEMCKYFYGKMRAHLMKEGQSGPPTQHSDDSVQLGDLQART